MQAIVADTTPVNYLALIQAVEFLPQLYGRVLIPPAVKAELSDQHAPNEVREWILRTHSWLHVISPETSVDLALSQLDLGEREAILLASETQAPLLMDERDGTAEARARGIKVIGTLGVLDAAATRGWLDLPLMFERLRETSFRSPLRLMAAMLEQNAARKRETND